MQATVLNQAQKEVLNVMSCLRDDEDLLELKRLLVNFLNERLQKDLDVLWDNGELSEEKLNVYRHEHLRTEYKC